MESAPGWDERTHTYSDLQPHAVESVTTTLNYDDSETEDDYEYDTNGKAPFRVEDGAIWLQSYNAENRMNGIQIVSRY